MSYQTSIHFDPTALLIIKNEIDHSIEQVESAVSSLIEDQTLPFGIDDALTQFEQCAHVLALIDMHSVAKVAQYSAELMRKIIAQPPTQIQLLDVEALSDGTSLLKRYIEFICLREVQIPQFLLTTLNRLELALNKPLTAEGEHLATLLDCIRPQFQLAAAPDLEKSQYVHRLYKLSLQQFLQQQHSELDVQAMKIVGAYVASAANHTPSAQYWQLVSVALNQIQQLWLTEPRLRTLISLERQIATLVQQPQAFEPALIDIANVLSLCISQEDEVAQHIREQLNIGDELLTDTQLKVFSRHLYGPDFSTMHSISELVSNEINQVRQDIEYNYLNMSSSKCQEIQYKLQQLAHIFVILNLPEVAKNLREQAQKLSLSQVAQPDFAEQVMDCIQSASNSVGILKRQHTSQRLQLGVHNDHISLHQLDDAHQVLLHETKALIDLSSQSLVQHVQDQDLSSLDNIPSQLREIGGALLFLNTSQGQRALNNVADFVQQRLELQRPLNRQHIDVILEPLASADMLIDNLKHQQPVMYAMFDIALRRSETLKNESP